MEDENDYLLLEDSHNSLNRWKNCFFSVNVHSVCDVRQIEIRTAE
jgi:hypothetical protein